MFLYYQSLFIYYSIKTFLCFVPWICSMPEKSTLPGKLVTMFLYYQSLMLKLSFINACLLLFRRIYFALFALFRNIGGNRCRAFLMFKIYFFVQLIHQGIVQPTYLCILVLKCFISLNFRWVIRVFGEPSPQSISPASVKWDNSIVGVCGEATGDLTLPLLLHCR
jgi:hypothetical protein